MTVARHGDRRIGSRRKEDAALHYTREALIGAALECAEGFAHVEMSGGSYLGRLKIAAANYQAAEKAAVPS